MHILLDICIMISSDGFFVPIVAASAQVLSPEEERKLLEDNIAKLRAILQGCEKKVCLLIHLLNVFEETVAIF